jgi:hypothetical protein
MATARPFAYNLGAGITGTTQVGDLAVGTPTAGFTSSPQFWNGPDEDLGYVIAHPVPAGTQPTPVSGVSAFLGFNRTSDFTDSSFINLAQYVAKTYSTPQTFSDANDASTWLTTNGFWNSYPASSTVLVMNLDSTTGVSGSTWTDSSTGGHNATLNGGYGTTTYNSNQVVTLNGTSGYVLPSSFGTQLNSTGFTYNVWVYPTTFNNGTIIAEFGGTPPNGWKDAQIALVSERINGGVFNPTAFSPTGYITGPFFSSNTWYNIAMTYNPTTKDLKLYINGTLNSTINGVKSNPGTLYLTLGRYDDAGSYLGGASGYFQGYVGSWKIWNGPISATSILSNYNLTKSRYGL